MSTTGGRSRPSYLLQLQRQQEYGFGHLMNLYIAAVNSTSVQQKDNLSMDFATAVI